MFVGGSLHGTNRMSVGFDCARLSLALIDEKMQKIWQLELHGLTAHKIIDLLRSELSNHGIESTQLGLALHYEIPDALADNEPFNQGNLKDLDELTRYFSNADATLHSIITQYEYTAPIRCWPHHFDIATLIKLDPHLSSEDARSIGVGLSPGDSGYPQPYFYVNMWPYPDIEDEKLPPLPGGSWHTKDWIGAVLTADEIVKQESQSQQSFVGNFLTSAITNMSTLLANNNL
jgi:hypothetical protein